MDFVETFTGHFLKARYHEKCKSYGQNTEIDIYSAALINFSFNN